MRQTIVLSVLILLAAFFAEAADKPSSWTIEAETGLAFSGYNDIQIPRSTGTRFSLSRDLDPESKWFQRLRIGVQIHPRHHISALYAPLSLFAVGDAPLPILFDGVQFPAGTSLRGKYRFNSYRLSWMYIFTDSETWRLGAGLTAKIRDASISLLGGGQFSEKTNVGFVPLIRFWAERRFGDKYSILIEGDALAAPQGRAEDVFLGATAQIAPEIRLKAGYRFVEGGANVEEVYNFAWIHFLTVGAQIRF